MGNSPSKNDSNISVLTAGQSSSGIIGELESEEKVALSRQKRYDNDSNDRKRDKRKSDKQNFERQRNEPRPNSDGHQHATIKIDTGRRLSLYDDREAHQLHRSGKAFNPLNSTSSSPRRVKRSLSMPRDSDFDFEIDMEAARLLNLPAAGSHSSVDSSDSSRSSPVFTINGKDDDTLSMNSVGSAIQLPDFTREELKATLRSIEEDSNETVSELVSEQNQLKMENLNLEKCSDKESSHESTCKLYGNDDLSKVSIESSDSGSNNTSVSRSAPATSTLTAVVSPQMDTRKSEVDVDSIIDRLLRIAFKHRPKNPSRNSIRDKLPLNMNEVQYLLHKARSIFLTQPGLLRLSPPVKIVGDIHGQYDDLVRIFKTCGFPPYSNYLFLGDYVDRGHKSLETFLLLICYKIKFQENFFMLRGNHESANVTKMYGFYDECKRRLPSRKMWKDFVDVFNSLPVAALINDKIFCVHGGLSPDLNNLNQVESIKRPTDVPDKGLLADLLWSDPDPLIRGSNWTKNDRGVSYCFGKKHVDYFCTKFKIDLIVRGHMVVEDGYEFFDKRKLVTIFLAPNYCGEFNNFGSVMTVDRRLCCSFELIRPKVS